MWALFYSFTIGFVAAVLFLIVDQFEPDRRYANVLKLLILAVVAAAIVRRLRIAAPAWPPRSCGNLVSIPDLYPMALAKGMARSKSHKICEAPLRGRRSVNFGPPTPSRVALQCKAPRGGRIKQTNIKQTWAKQTNKRAMSLFVGSGRARSDKICEPDETQPIASSALTPTTRDRYGFTQHINNHPMRHRLRRGALRARHRQLEKVKP
jgi:hypothetical protein